MNSERLFRTLDVFLPSSYLSLRLPLRHRTPWILILEVGFPLYLAFTWLNTEICPIGLPKVCSVNHSVLNVSGVFRNKNSSAYSSPKLRSACEIGCACADLMHAIGLASSLLISHVVNKEEIEFKAGNNPMSEVICTVSWKDSQLEWNQRGGRVSRAGYLPFLICFLVVPDVIMNTLLITSNYCMLLCKFRSNYLYLCSRKFWFPFMWFSSFLAGGPANTYEF